MNVISKFKMYSLCTKDRMANKREEKCQTNAQILHWIEKDRIETNGTFINVIRLYQLCALCTGLIESFRKRSGVVNYVKCLFIIIFRHTYTYANNHNETKESNNNGFRAVVFGKTFSCISKQRTKNKNENKENGIEMVFILHLPNSYLIRYMLCWCFFYFHCFG